MTAVVEAQRISHVYPAKRKQPPHQALREVSLEVAAGETFGLLGPNGGGKSTLFRILSTYFPPTSGRAAVLGLDLVSQAAKLRPLLGVVFQNPSLDARLTVRENMIHQGHLYGLSGPSLASRVAEMLDRYRLSERAGDLAGSLSGGLRRRVELAKGLLHRPRLILLDEPSTGLDPGARRDLWDHLKDLKRAEGTTLLATTHLMDEAERCDRLALLDRGQIVALGAPDALRAEIGGDVIAIESPDPSGLARGLEERFQTRASIVAGTLRLERRQGHTFIPQLVEAFPGLIRSVNLSKPTLEDVFIHHTGRRFWSDGQAAEAAAA